MDKINALELVGSVILHNTAYSKMPEKWNYESKNTAFMYWHRALRLRLLDTGRLQPYPKDPIESNRPSGQRMEHSG